MNTQEPQNLRQQRVILGRVGQVGEVKTDRNAHRYLPISVVVPGEADKASGETPDDEWHNFNAYGDTAIERYKALLRPGMNVVAVYNATLTEANDGEPRVYGRVVRIAPDPVLEGVQVAPKQRSSQPREPQAHQSEPSPAQGPAR